MEQTLWEKLTHVPGYERINKHYSSTFPMEVRYVCSRWIEDKILPELYADVNDPQVELRATNFLQSLIQQVEQEKQKLKLPDQILLKCRLEEAIKNFTQNLFNPMIPFRQICEAITFEKQFLQNIDANPQFGVMDSEAFEIYENLKRIKGLVHENTEVAKNYQQDFERYLIYFSTESKKIQSLSMNETDPNKIEQINIGKANIQSMTHALDLKVSHLWSCTRNIIEMISDMQKIVIHTRLGNWQKEQAAAGNGGPLNTNALNDIQMWFEELAELLWNTRSTIDTIKRTNSSYQPNNQNYYNHFNVCYNEISGLLQNLIVSGFIVEKQPPQVMKTNTRFGATVRLLTTNISIHLNNPIVQVSILSEAQAIAQQQNHCAPITETSGEIVNNTGNLELHQTSHQLICSFRNMQLKKIKRAEKKGTESVMDEKFSLLFQAKFQSGDMQLNVWVMSLPVVVIVHGNQEPQSWATITWDNAFAEISRIPFAVVDRISWPQMAVALNTKFTSQTGRSLTQDNLFYLCEKLFRASPNTFNPDERMVTWSLFCKEPLPDRNFTFWDWFYAVMKLTRDQLRGPWNDNLIIGFINKKQAEDTLKKYPGGTFLLRFSDSELGGITIAWVDYGTSEPQIVMLQPFLHKDFTIRALGDRIHDLPQCITLYPDMPKDKAFGPYYTPIGDTTSNGYVRHLLKATVPGEMQTMSIYPNSPANNGWPSPDHTTRDTASVQSSIYNASINGVQEVDNFNMFLNDDEVMDMYSV